MLTGKNSSVTSQQIQTNLNQAISWVKQNLHKYLPDDVKRSIPFENISWELDNEPDMIDRDIGITPQWVLKINLRNLNSSISTLADKYDVQSVMVHEIIEMGLYSYFSFYSHSNILHLISQEIENIHRWSRGLGTCSVCFNNFVFRTTTKNTFELFDLAERTFCDPAIKAIWSSYLR